MLNITRRAVMAGAVATATTLMVPYSQRVQAEDSVSVVPEGFPKFPIGKFVFPRNSLPRDVRQLHVFVIKGVPQQAVAQEYGGALLDLAADAVFVPFVDVSHVACGASVVWGSTFWGPFKSEASIQNCWIDSHRLIEQRAYRPDAEVGQLLDYLLGIYATWNGYPPITDVPYPLT